MSPFLEMIGITKRFPGVIANNQVNFAIQQGEIHALLGENGAGKSTLMQILYGFYERDEGEILLEGEKVDIRNPSDAIQHGIGMIHQDFMLVPRFSVVENVILGLEETGSGPLLDLKSAAKRLIDLSVQHGLEVDPWARVENLSVGEQQRVEILKLLYRNARILILDEPTAVLTPQETERLIDVLHSLAESGHSVVFITHKLHEVMAVAQRVTILRDGCVVSTVETRSTNPRQLAKMMVGREVVFRIEKQPQQPGQRRLLIENVYAQNSMRHGKLNGLSLEVHSHEILGLAGVDGNGQSDLAEALMNLQEVSGGRILIDEVDITRLPPAERRALGLSYIPADRRSVGTVASLNIAHNAILGDVHRYTTWRNLIIDDQKVSAHARSLMATYDVRAPGIHLDVSKLSGGNLQKVVLGRELMKQPRVLVVEQPTRGLDIGATEFIRQQLLAARDEGMAILLISTELDEVLALSDRIAVIYRGEIMGVLPAQSADVEKIGLMMAGSRLEQIR
jgi:general nucleoside transport system ATP-binding protein